MELDQELSWRGRSVRWARQGSGPPVVFCHGTPWSTVLWQPFAAALSAEFTVYLWDMPGYGRSSKHPGHPVSLDVQGELFADLLDHWGLTRPHVVAHDYGGAVSLRAHLLHRAPYASLALVDVVALAPWGSDLFRLVRDNAEVFTELPADVHEAVVRAYIQGASHRGLREEDLESLVGPWLGPEGQAAFYRQIAQADQRYTDDVEPRYGTLDLPVFVENDAAAAAMGEMQLGHGQRHNSFFYLLISLGLGGGLVVDGNYVRGADGRSGEIGFMHAGGGDDEPQIQTLVSLSGLARHLEAGGFTLGDAMREDMAADVEASVAEWIAQAARQLVPAMSAVNCLINPAAVLVGGRLPRHLVERLAEAVNVLMAECASYLPAIAPVARAELSEDAPAVGAAILPFSHFLLPKPGALWKAAEATA